MKQEISNTIDNSEFSFTIDDIPEGCPYHPYVIDQAIEQYAKINQTSLKEAFKEVTNSSVEEWFEWNTSSQKRNYWFNIYKELSFIPENYTPKYFKETSELLNTTVQPVEFVNSESTATKPKHNAIKIPCAYEEVVISFKKKPIHF